MKTHLVRQLFLVTILTFGACSSNPKVVSAPPPAGTSDTVVNTLPPGAGTNLFTPAPTYNGSAPTINPISTDPNQTACLTNGYYGSPQIGQQGYSSIPSYTGATSSPYCLNSQVPLQQNLLDAGVQTYGYLYACLQTVLAQQPQNESAAAQAHIAGRMALIRCYQQIVQNMQQVQPWGGPQLSLFGQQKDILTILIVLLSK